ncbi:MAG: hypothetical protein LUE10_08315 [Alistipes sp.]|nr:hypothetical protein [Alistipes sp.]
MKILMVSYFFTPEITPRAYRTAELAKALARRGNEVTLVLPNKTAFARIDPADKAYKNIRLVFAGGRPIPGAAPRGRSRLRARLPGWLLRAILYFYNHEYFAKYDRELYRTLASLEGDFDLLISISYPVAIHRAVMNAMRTNSRLGARVKVAEFSDPPLRGEYNSRFFPAYGLFLKRAGRFFDKFIIPVENALPVYLPYKPHNEISVIPQGFDNSGITLVEYRPHQRPTFALAGRFYRNTRDPEPFFEFLARSGRDFHLVLYLIDRDPWFDAMIEKYNSLARGTISVREPLPRDELIRQLSGMDFLVNHDFNYPTATPSKLIDYALAGRPVYSFRSDSFDPALARAFLDGDYSGATALPDPAFYDIDGIAARFEHLAAGK